MSYPRNPDCPLCPQARTILTKATRVRFRQVEDLAAVWCEFGEMELRHENYDEALRILRVRRDTWVPRTPGPATGDGC